MCFSIGLYLIWKWELFDFNFWKTLQAFLNVCKKKIFYLDKISGAVYQIIYAYMYTKRQPQ